VVHGVAEAMLFAAFFAYAADIIPESRRIEGIAIFGVSGLLPVSVGGLIGDLLLADHGYPVLFAATVALALAALVAAATLPPLPPPDDPGRAPARGILRTLLDPRLMPLWMIGVAFAGALTSVVTFLKTFVLTAGVGSVGLFWTAYTATAIGLRLPLGSVPDRFGPKRVLAASIGFFAAGLLLLARAESDLDVGVAGGLGGIGHAYVFPILISIVVDRAPVADRGAALAIFTALFDAGVLIGGPCLGALVHRTSYPVMYSAASAVAVVACAVFLVWDRRND
jgi:predicted MFS family arabinose efflux permease